MTKPSNPVQYIIDFLQDRYPDQVRVAAARAPRGRVPGDRKPRRRARRAQVSAPRAGFAAAAGIGGNAVDAGRSDDEGDDDADDDDDYVDELPATAALRGGIVRRAAVSAESGLDPQAVLRRLADMRTGKVRRGRGQGEGGLRVARQRPAGV